MGAIATFDYAVWVAMFPEFAACTPAQGQAWWNTAQLFFANDGTGPVQSPTDQQTYLNWLTAHVAWLRAPRDPAGNPAAAGAPPPATVGRISNASEGSVSVAVEWPASGNPSEAWYVQTQYGATFWQLTAGFRTFRYSARPTPWPAPGRGWPWRGGRVQGW